jgi:hypothetical protein
LLEAIEREQPFRLGEAISHVTPGVRRTIVHLQRPKTALLRGYIDGDQLGAPRVRRHRIDSTYASKRIVYRDGETRDWVPGINLWTWCRLGGVYPDRPHVLRQVEAAADGHGDLRPWNFILAGEVVVPIDVRHRQKRSGPAALAETLAWIENPALACL